MQDASGLATIIEMGGEGRRLLFLIGVAMARLVPVMQIVPFLGGRHISGTVRGAIGFSLALFLAPWLGVHAPEGMDAINILPVLIKEACLGTLFGFLSSLAFFAASGVGFLADNQRGSSMAQMSDPLSGDDTSPLGSLAIETLIMVFLAIGGMALFFQAILTTYAFWPPFSFWPNWSSAPLRELFLGQFSWYLTTMAPTTS